MNVFQQRALALADTVERSASFGMQSYTNECGTPACLAGHAAYTAVGHNAEAYSKLDIKTTGPMAAGWLGIDQRTCLALFAPGQFKRDTAMIHATLGLANPGSYSIWAKRGEPGHITAKHAAACLRKFAHTGAVDWVGTAEGWEAPKAELPVIEAEPVKVRERELVTVR